MSAPQTNIEKQRRRHIGPLIGMSAVAIFAVLLIVYWLFEVVDEGSESAVIDAPEAAATGTADQGIVDPATDTTGAPATTTSP